MSMSPVVDHIRAPLPSASPASPELGMGNIGGISRTFLNPKNAQDLKKQELEIKNFGKIAIAITGTLVSLGLICFSGISLASHFINSEYSYALLGMGNIWLGYFGRYIYLEFFKKPNEENRYEGLIDEVDDISGHPYETGIEKNQRLFFISFLNDFKKYLKLENNDEKTSLRNKLFRKVQNIKNKRDIKINQSYHELINKVWESFLTLNNKVHKDFSKLYSNFMQEHLLSDENNKKQNKTKKYLLAEMLKIIDHIQHEDDILLSENSKINKSDFFRNIEIIRALEGMDFEKVVI